MAIAVRRLNSYGKRIDKTAFELCWCFMPKQTNSEPLRLLKLAEALRESAHVASLPGYSAQLIRAAEGLEKRAMQTELRVVVDNQTGRTGRHA